MRGIRNKPTKSDLDWMNKSKATKIFELFASQELFYNAIMLTDAFNPPPLFPPQSAVVASSSFSQRGSPRLTSPELTCSSLLGGKTIEEKKGLKRITHTPKKKKKQREKKIATRTEYIKQEWLDYDLVIL